MVSMTQSEGGAGRPAASVPARTPARKGRRTTARDGAPNAGNERGEAREPAGDAAATGDVPCRSCPLEGVARRDGKTPEALFEELLDGVRDDRRMLEALLATGVASGESPARPAGPADAEPRDGLLARLYAAVDHRLDAVDRPAEEAGAAAADRDARVLQTLAKTVETLKGLEAAGGDAEAGRDLDLDVVRAEIARRLDRLGAAG
jgi:hypothetical protein